MDIADWPGYMSPLVAQVLPVGADSFMKLVGLVELAVGGAILAGYTQLGGSVLATWLVAIALNLASIGRYLDIAVRDLGMSVAAFALRRLSEAGVGAVARQTTPDLLVNRKKVNA